MNFLNKKLRFHGQSWWEENQQNKSPTNGLDQKELSLHHSDKYKKFDYPKAKLCHLLHPKKRKSPGRNFKGFFKWRGTMLSIGC